MDKHAPLKTITVTERDPTPWSSKDIRKEKKARRRLERKWRRTRLTVDEELVKKQKNKVTTMLNKFDQDSLTKDINENKDGQKGLFNIVNTRTHRKVKTPYPDNESDQHLADGFSDCFANKTDMIRSKLDNNNQNIQHNEILFTGTPLSEF